MKDEPKDVLQSERLIVHRLPDGGYMILDKPFDDMRYSPPLFACTTMKEALDYIKYKMGKDR